jgi:hypothetical protein
MSGVPLVLGSMALLAAAARRGSRTERVVSPARVESSIMLPSPGKEWPGRFDMEKAKEDLWKLVEWMNEEYGGRHWYGTRGTAERKGVDYVFNVKMWNAPSWPPDYDELEEKTGMSSEQLDSIVWDTLSAEREWAEEDLKERYEWIDETASQGRSGGYLVVVADSNLQDSIEDLENWEPDREHTIAGPRFADWQVNDARELYAEAYGRLRDLRKIEEEIPILLEASAKYVASKEFWESYIEEHQQAESNV